MLDFFALSAPLLWTTINFGLNASVPHIRVMLRAFRTVRMFLNRSQNASLDVELEFRSANFHNRESLDWLLPMLAPHTHRFRSISIDVSDKESARRLFPLQGAFPRLSRVTVECFRWDERAGIGDLPLFPTDSRCVTSLRHLSLTGSDVISGTQKVDDAVLCGTCIGPHSRRPKGLGLHTRYLATLLSYHHARPANSACFEVDAS